MDDGHPDLVGQVVRVGEVGLEGQPEERDRLGMAIQSAPHSVRARLRRCRTGRRRRAGRSPGAGPRVGSSAMTMATSSRAAANGIGMVASASSTRSSNGRWAARRGPGGDGRSANRVDAWPWLPYPRGVTDGPAGFVVTVDPGDRIHFLDWTAPDVDRRPGTVGDRARPRPGVRRPGSGRRSPAGSRRGPTPIAGDGPARPRALRRPDRGRRLRPGPPGRGRRRGRRRRRLSTRPDDPAARSCLAGHGFGAIVAAVARRAPRVALCGPRPRRRRLGTHRGRHGPGRRRVPARPRRAARGHGLDARVPARPARLRPGRPGTPTRRQRPGRPSSRPTPGASCRRRDRTPSRPASGRCSAYDPGAILPGVEAPIVALVAAAATDAAVRVGALAAIDEDRVAAGRGPIRAVRLAATGHNLMRYRPADVTAAILDLAARPRTAT